MTELIEWFSELGALLATIIISLGVPILGVGLVIVAIVTLWRSSRSE